MVYPFSLHSISTASKPGLWRQLTVSSTSELFRKCISKKLFLSMRVYITERNENASIALSERAKWHCWLRDAERGHSLPFGLLHLSQSILQCLQCLVDLASALIHGGGTHVAEADVLCCNFLQIKIISR
jgi:hypothetical protein